MTDPASGLLGALAAEREAAADLRARCAEVERALLTARPEAVRSAVAAEERAALAWTACAMRRTAEARALGRRLGLPPGADAELADALRRAGAEGAAAELDQAMGALGAARTEVRESLRRSRLLLRQAISFTEFALRGLAALVAGAQAAVPGGYTGAGRRVPATPHVMDRRA